MLTGAQNPEGAEAAGGWHVSTAPSMCTSGRAATAPRLSPSFALRSEWVPTTGRSQAAGAGTSKPARTGGPSRAPKSTGIPQSAATAWAATAAPGGRAPACSVKPEARACSCGLGGCSYTQEGRALACSVKEVSRSTAVAWAATAAPRSSCPNSEGVGLLEHAAPAAPPCCSQHYGSSHFRLPPAAIKKKCQSIASVLETTLATS